MTDEIELTADDPTKKHKLFDAMELYGTVVESARLTPNAICGAAAEDLKRKVRNKGSTVGVCEHYAFHRKHVHKAENAKHLIELALGDRDLGCLSGKRNTRMIYRDEALLEQAKNNL